jgi:hypothetical protein
MKTLEEIYDLIQTVNDRAHVEAWDSWMAADAEEDYELAEELREDASALQSDWFRTFYWQLSDEDREAVVHWLKNDADFAEEFEVWYDSDAFAEEIDLDSTE